MNDVTYWRVSVGANMGGTFSPVSSHYFFDIERAIKFAKTINGADTGFNAQEPVEDYTGGRQWEYFKLLAEVQQIEKERALG